MSYNFDGMDGHEFEKYLMGLFKRIGYRGEVTKGSGDYGVDLILYEGDKKIAVQAKRYKSNVSVGGVQEVIAGKLYYGADRALVITTSSYTRQALNLAQTANVSLWGRSELEQLMITASSPNPKPNLFFPEEVVSERSQTEMMADVERIYDEATEFMNKKEYAKALLWFKRIRFFKDSEQLIEEIRTMFKRNVA